MSKWSSFEQDQEYTNSWRQHLESEELDEGVWDKAKGKWDKAAAKAAKIKGGAQKAGAGAEKARQAATGAYDWIANFLGGNVKDKDYSHLKMPTPDRPTAKGAEPEGEESAKTDPLAGSNLDQRDLDEQARQFAESGGSKPQENPPATRNKPRMSVGPDKRLTGLPVDAGNQNVDTRNERRVG